MPAFSRKFWRWLIKASRLRDSTLVWIVFCMSTNDMADEPEPVLLWSYGVNHKAISLTSASKSSTCGRVNRTIDSTAIRFFFLLHSQGKETSRLAWILNCRHCMLSRSVRISTILFSSPLRPISQLVQQYFIVLPTCTTACRDATRASSGGIVLFSAIKSSSMRAFLLQSSQPVEYAKTASLLQVTHSFKQSSQALNQH